VARTSPPPARTVGGKDFVARCEAIRAEAVQLLGRDRVRTDDASRLLHSYDASLESGSPDLVVAPRSSDELRALIAAAYRHGVPFVMRGAGTGYSGGALPSHGGMVVLTAGLDRILEVDFDEGWIRCEPGVVLAEVQQRAAAGGWRYLPDPSSYQVCTIGGNLAENAGGPHALGAGPTSHHVIAVEVIRPDGEPVVLHEQHPWDGGLDLRALMIGSEGTLGAISSATLRLVRAPAMECVVVATFTHQEDAVATVAASFDTGLLPSAMDMLTGAFIPDRPAFADPSLLFVGLQGHQEEVADQAERLARHIRDHDGRFELLDLAAFLQRRAELVRDKVRRMVAASGCPRYYLFDAVAPRSRLAGLMDAIRQAASEFGLPVLNTFHAGDGNVHPTPFYDPDDPDHRARLSGFSTQVLRECQRMGGSLSGEHGIGTEKRELMAEFCPRKVLEIMRAVKRAADPENLSNPGKIIPPVVAPPVVTDSPVRLSMPGRSRVNLIDALIEIDDAAVTFADVEAKLAGTPYELPYEPLGGTPDQAVLAAIDLGLPALREPSPARPRDLILGAELRRDDAGAAIELGGRCAKDVAGYELRKLVYGGRGRLGTLSAARLRLLPRPTDSRVIHGVAMTSDAAVALCRRLSTLALPFRYLGILITTDGAATVTGRLELTGGVLDRHLEILHVETADMPWMVLTGSRWLDPVMQALANPTTALVGAPHVLTHRAGRLARLANHGRTVFISTGHARTWWRGQPHAFATSDGWLVDGVVRSFAAAHR
jgi:glycolate dehydrogenase FAD-linked subunit